jgi:hypothetical protein
MRGEVHDLRGLQLFVSVDAATVGRRAIRSRSLWARRPVLVRFLFCAAVAGLAVSLAGCEPVGYRYAAPVYADGYYGGYVAPVYADGPYGVGYYGGGYVVPADGYYGGLCRCNGGLCRCSGP